MSGHATVETAKEATRIGAVDFLEKPISMQKLLDAVNQGLSSPVIVPEHLIHDPAQATGSVAGAAVVSTPQDDSYLGPISLQLPLREARDEFERIYFEYHL